MNNMKLKFMIAFNEEKIEYYEKQLENAKGIINILIYSDLLKDYKEVLNKLKEGE